MTPEEKFLFDLNGYLVIKNVLSPEELAALNAIADEKTADNPSLRAGRVSRWGAPYQALIDHPKIVPYLVELIDSRFRLDHDYCIFMKAGDSGGICMAARGMRAITGTGIVMDRCLTASVWSPSS